MDELTRRLAEQILRADTPTGYRWGQDAVEEHPPLPDGAQLTGFEMDLRLWGFVYGLAYGIARGEDPFESNGSVAARADAAAHVVWAEFNFDAQSYAAHLAEMRERLAQPLEVVR